MNDLLHSLVDLLELRLDTSAPVNPSRKVTPHIRSLQMRKVLTSTGGSISAACPKMTKALAPTSQNTVEIGEAMNPKGTVMHTNVVYNCDVVKSIGPIRRFSPASLPIPSIPPTANPMTSSKRGFDTSAQMAKSAKMTE